MTFRWETANVCGAACDSPSLTTKENILLKNNTQRWVGPTLCTVFSSVSGIHCPKEGTSASLIVLHNGDKPDKTSLLCILKNNVLGACQHLPMKLQG